MRSSNLEKLVLAASHHAYPSFSQLAAALSKSGWMKTDRKLIGRLNEYQVIGRHLPTEAMPTPKLYRMRIFAPNDVVAKSRFWYFLTKLRKVKRANGEVVSLNVVCVIWELYFSALEEE